MSMKYHPCHAYGLYIPKDDFNHLIRKYKEINDLKELDDEEIMNYYLEAIDIEDTYDNLYNACTLLLNNDEMEEGYFLPSQKKDGSIFKSDTHLLFDTPQDMADEFKAEFDELLPEDFDYIKNLALYEYVYYG